MEFLDPGRLLVNRITSFSWSKDPVDLQPGYIRTLLKEEQATKGSAMPPSPACDYYYMKHWYRTDTVEAGYKLQFKLRPGMELVVRDLLKRNPLQLTHRSRLATFLYNPLQVNEFRRRSSKAKETYSATTDLRLDAGDSIELYHAILFTTLKMFRFDYEYIVKYAKEHETSSTGEGLMWKELITRLNIEDWKYVFDATMELIEGLVDKVGWYIATRFYLGARSRSEDISSNEIIKYMNDGFNAVYTRVINRARLVMFHPALSIWSAFLPDKQSWYKAILLAVEDILGIADGLVHYPLVDGGQIYVTASEWLSSGYQSVSFDGVTWDAQVGSILGQPFQALLAYLDGTSQVPSGITVTSLLDTIAMLVVYKRYFTGYRAIILGDDITIYYKGQVPKATTVLIEYQDDDTRRQFLLGLNYADDPLAPVVDGLKIMSDRADLQYRLDYAIDEVGSNGIQRGKHSYAEQLTYYGMYYGRFGDKTLIEAVSKSAEEAHFQGPTQSIFDLAKRVTTVDEAGAWASELGLRPGQVVYGVE